MSKQEMEQANWQIAHTWAEGLGLEYAGIDLGDLTVYSLLSILGRVEMNEQEKAQAPNA